MSAESVVRRYLETVFGAGTRDELEALLHPELRFVEHPNLVNPRGTERDRQTMLETFDRGRALLARQSFAIDQLSVRGGEVVVRGTWTGAVAAARRRAAGRRRAPRAHRDVRRGRGRARPPPDELRLLRAAARRLTPVSGAGSNRVGSLCVLHSVRDPDLRRTPCIDRA
jgi:hypothetical protein